MLIFSETIAARRAREGIVTDSFNVLIIVLITLNFLSSNGHSSRNNWLGVLGCQNQLSGSRLHSQSQALDVVYVVLSISI